MRGAEDKQQAAVILKEPITRKKSFGVFMGVSGGLMLLNAHLVDKIMERQINK